MQAALDRDLEEARTSTSAGRQVSPEEDQQADAGASERDKKGR